MVEKGYLWRRASDGTELLTRENLGDIPSRCAKNPYYDETDGRYKFSFFNTPLTNVEMVYENGGRVDYNKPALPPCIEGYDVVFVHSKTETGGTADIVCTTITTPEEYEAAKARENGIKVYSYGVDMAFENVYYNEYANPKSFTIEETLMDKKPADAQGPLYEVNIYFDKSRKLNVEWGWYNLS